MLRNVATESIARGIAGCTLLIIDDEPHIRRMLRATLLAEGARVLDMPSGEQGLDLLSQQTVDLVLLDMNMPGLSGLETCREIRSFSNVPIIIVSVCDTHGEKVEALDAGADDFVCKPFSTDVLMARIRAALRRTQSLRDKSPRRISTSHLEVDFIERRVKAGGKPVRLTPIEFDLLRRLAAQPNEAVPYRRLLGEIWGAEFEEQIEYVRVFVNQLRKKIEPPGSKPTFIVTAPKVGYYFAMDKAGVVDISPA